MEPTFLVKCVLQIVKKKIVHQLTVKEKLGRAIVCRKVCSTWLV